AGEFPDRKTLFRFRHGANTSQSPVRTEFQARFLTARIPASPRGHCVSADRANMAVRTKVRTPVQTGVRTLKIPECRVDTRLRRFWRSGANRCEHLSHLGAGPKTRRAMPALLDPLKGTHPKAR